MSTNPAPPPPPCPEHKLTRHSAYVVADPKQVSEQEIKSFVAKQVAPYKQLRGGVVFIPAIPKSPSGKILRKDLREMAKRDARSSKL